MAREALGIAGAGVGLFLTGGSPLGASIGYAIGSGIGGYLDPTVVPAPGLGEAPIQTGRDGIPIPIVWGICHLHGNIIQTGPIDEVTTSSRQGKGGSTSVEETRRFRTFAIGLCEGPIASVSRIWENDRLVFDTRTASQVDADDQADYAEKITIHYGSDSQLADTDLESITGTGNQPAYRDLANIVYPNFDITDTGSAIPQFRYEVNGFNDQGITSRPYSVEQIDGWDNSIAPRKTRQFDATIEGWNNSSALDSISMVAPKVVYTAELEGWDNSAVVTSILEDEVLVPYTAELEGWDNSAALTDITITPLLIEYDYDLEGWDNSATLTGITIS